MTIADFKDSVSSYSNRVAALFQSVGALDILLQAMNDARRDAQRRYPFNLAKQQVFVQLSMLPSSFLTDFKADDTGAGATLVVRRLDALWEYGTTQVGAMKAYYPTKQVDVRPQATLGFAVPSQPWAWQRTDPSAIPNFAYVQGTNLRHSTLTTVTWLMGDAVVLLPDLVAADAPDFFLTYFPDWLKFATLANLNVWLKDTEQIQIDGNLVSWLWDSVKNFDSQQNSVGPITLD